MRRSGWTLFAWLAAVLLALSAGAEAETLRETGFSELGFEGFQVEGVNQVDCGQAFFLEAQGSSLPGEATIASLHLNVSPVWDRFDFNVFLNKGQAPVAEVNEKILAGEWLRVWLPAAELRQKNELRWCAKTSFSATRIGVEPDSRVGVYRLPDFSSPDSFTMEPSETSPVVGDEFAIAVKVRNRGGADAVIDFSYRKPSLEEKQPEIVVLKGATEARQALVPKCRAYSGEGACVQPGEKEFVYWVKAAEATKMSLLPAQFEYVDVFGERQARESNRPSIEAMTAKVKVKPLILSEKEIVKVGQTYVGRVALKNTSLAGVSDVRLSLRVDPGLTLEGNDVKEFEFIPAQGTEYLEVRVKADAPGAYALGCETVYQEVRLRFAECEPVTITVEEDNVNPALLAGLALVVVAGLAYGYINRS